MLVTMELGLGLAFGLIWVGDVYGIDWLFPSTGDKTRRMYPYLINVQGPLCSSKPHENRKEPSAGVLVSHL